MCRGEGDVWKDEGVCGRVRVMCGRVKVCGRVRAMCRGGG